MLLLCFFCVIIAYVMDKVRRNYFLKEDIAEFAKQEAEQKGCSASYFIQMLIEDYQRRKYFEEE